MAKVSLRAYNREIETMLDGGSFSEAVAHSLHILKTFPKHLETYRLLGKAYLELKQYSNATDIFNRVLACVPGDFVAHVGMGIIRDEENKLDDAIWHMERAFETQPSNPAIQSELQRLYARRDGSAPPRIRITRGALAQMYLQGELFPQAISEIKGLLNEDPSRSDMQTLLARAHFRSGQKSEAVEVASSLLHRYPYNLDANRVLAEILGADRHENAESYRQRVFELDPYAAHSSAIFQSSEAPDSALALEKLDWNGQPMGVAPEWGEAPEIGPGRAAGLEEQPDWLRDGFRDRETVPPTPLVPPVSGISSTQGTGSDIPEFMRKHGWKESTGAFDESKPVFAEETGEQSPAIAAADLPDWIKEMKPAEAQMPDHEKEDLPDWMNRIDPGILGAASAATPSNEQPEWLQRLEQPPTGFAEAQPAQGMPDWLEDLGESETLAQPASMTGSQPDWLKPMGAEPKEPDQDAPFFAGPQIGESSPIPVPPAMTETPETTEKDLDDSFAWLESLAARQGATEGLLMKPEERLEQEPDWVKQAKSLGGELPQVEANMPVAAESVQPFVESRTQSPGDIESLGKSEQEQDDSFAWLENLAAKQGATEGLLTNPEDRLQQEPDWVKQAKEIGGEEIPPVETGLPIPSEDTAGWLRSMDQAEQSIEPAAEDDTSVWLKSLDEETKSEPSLESSAGDTDMWLKGLGEEEIKPEPLTGSADETALWLKNLDEAESAQAAPSADLPDWMQSIEPEIAGSETEAAAPEVDAGEPSWIGSTDQAVPPIDTGGLPSWLR